MNINFNFILRGTEMIFDLISKWPLLLISGSYSKFLMRSIILTITPFILVLIISLIEGSHWITDSNYVYKINQDIVVDSLGIGGSKIHIKLLNLDNIDIPFNLQISEVVKGENQVPHVITSVVSIDSSGKTVNHNVGCHGRNVNAKIFSIKNQKYLQLSFIGIGLLEDYGNYFLFLGMFLFLVLYRLLFSRNFQLFFGNDIDLPNIPTDITSIAIVEEKNILQYSTYDAATTVSLKNTIKDNFLEICYFKSRRSKIFLSLLFLFIIYLAVLVPIFYPPVQYHWCFSSEYYEFSYYSNMVKDFFLWGIIFTPLTISVLFIFTTISNHLRKSAGIFSRFKYTFYTSTNRTSAFQPIITVIKNIFYLSIVFIPHIFTTTYILNYPSAHYFIYPIYFAFTLLVLVLPLYLIHRILIDFRYSELTLISVKLKTLFDAYFINPITATNLDEFQKVKKFYDEEKKLPSWSLEVSAVVKFLSYVVTNILAFLSQHFFK